MRHRHQLKLTNPKQTWLALQALEFSRDNVLIETPTIYFMQMDAVRLFYYLENRLTTKVHSYRRKKLYDDQAVLYEQVRKFLVDDILMYTWAFAKVPIEVVQSGYTPVLALTCGESSPHSVDDLRAIITQEGNGKTKKILTAMRQVIDHQGQEAKLLLMDIDYILEGL